MLCCCPRERFHEPIRAVSPPAAATSLQWSLSSAPPTGQSYRSLPNMDDLNDTDAFLAFRGEIETPIKWKDPPPIGRRAQILLEGAEGGSTTYTPSPVLSQDPSSFGWDDLDEGPPDSDESWVAFEPKDHDKRLDGKALSSYGGKKLNKEQREKMREQEQLQQARESIRKRGWTDGEVKWRSWLARRGHDVMVHDWNLNQYIDGECIPPSRDPFWLNANEKPLPDYEAGNDLPDEEGPDETTTILSERIRPKNMQRRPKKLKPLWHDVNGAKLVEEGLGRVSSTYMWRQTVGMVFVEVKIPEGTSARDLNVTMTPTHLSIQIGADPPLFDEELYMKIYVGSNADNDCSIWEVQDKRVVVFHLIKWHRLAAGNVRDSSRTWWRKCFLTEEPFELTHPHGEYYNQKDK
ncbi:hypothetical protein AB1Y20_017830 [Prymnesium parvum]|uniref:CS domain-containing protein n=1 Tax=Prymnesium parvum TaxID=97485 RepID=A0AB34JPL2_PRYPA